MIATAMPEKTDRQKAEKNIAENRKAFHDFHILETFEAGVALLGTEVKAIREGRVNLRDSYGRVEGGEVFVLDMGEPVKIVDLARDLIRLSGLEEGVDVDIVISGIRPGEKLYEEVFFGHEAIQPTSHPKVLRSPADPVDAASADLIETLIQSALREPDNWDALRVQLRALVPDFHAPLPPPPAEDSEKGTPRTSAERRLRLA